MAKPAPLNLPYLSTPPLKKIYYDKSLSKSVIVQNVLRGIKNDESYQNTEFAELEDYKEFIKESQNSISAKYDKRTLLIYPEKGNYLHACPGSDGVVCCRYHVLDFGMNCPYDCQYCYLQTYAKIPFLTVAGNVDFLLADLKQKIAADPEIQWRIGSGEYADSLALDKLTGMGKILIEFFSQIDNATLELKTKSVEIEHLLGLNHNGKTVISWSLNPEYLVENVELYCSSMKQRVAAAKKAIEAGFQVAFHFDPVIYFDNWENEYSTLIEYLFSSIPETKIRWISLGTFRYSPGLKEQLRLRHPDEFITRAEMFLARDNKYRYLAPIRIKIYEFLLSEMQKYSPEMMVYLCMETRSIWKRTFNEEIIGPAKLDARFEARRQTLIKKG
ncbi:MAG: hypothetical protein OEV66_01415 [Spirochaetia bacterium]|nr:hypothetical protein [Spirochaetia bacterium]